MTQEFDEKKYEMSSKEWCASIIAKLRLTGTERVLGLVSGDGVLTSQNADLLLHERRSRSMLPKA